MHNQYHGRFEKEYWVRRIYTLIQNINDLSGSNIDLKSEISVCKFKDEDYCIVTYFYYSKLYCSCIKKQWADTMNERLRSAKNNYFIMILNLI